MPAGRPSEYLPEYAEVAATLALNGATDMEIADEFDVSVRTLYSWKIRYPEFLQALRYGKEQADDRVERALYQRAVGYEQETVKIGFFEGSPVFAKHREYIAPDPGAAKMWLTNRRGAEWREKVDVEHSGEIAVKQVVVDV